MVRKFNVRNVTVKLQTNSVDWDSVDALSWNSPNFPLDQVSNLAASPWKKRNPTRNRIYSSCFQALHLHSTSDTAVPKRNHGAAPWHIHHFPEREKWLIQVISWLRLRRQNTPGTKSSRSDPAQPCWFTEGLAGSSAHRRHSDSHTQPCSPHCPGYTEEQTLPRSIPSIEGDLRLNWGLRTHKKESSAPRLTLHTAHHGPAVASCPQEQPVETPAGPAQDRSCQSHPWLLELELLNNKQHEALQPSCQPISF